MNNEVLHHVFSFSRKPRILIYFIFTAALLLTPAFGSMPDHAHAAESGRPTASVLAVGEVADANCGEVVTLSAEVANTGGVVLPEGAKVWFWVTGPGWRGSHWVGAANIGGLESEAGQWFSCDWTLPEDLQSGSYRCWAQVWYQRSILSRWSDPASFAVVCTASGASAEVLELTPVTEARCGTTVSLSANVSNTGDTVLPDGSKVWFFVDGNEWRGRPWVGHADVSGLAAGASEWYSLNWTVPEGLDSGDYEYRAQVWHGRDALSVLSDPQAFALVCRDSASSVIDALHQPVDPTCGSTVTLAADVTNNGLIELPPNAFVWFYVDGPEWRGRHWVGRAGAAGLAPGATAAFSCDWDVPANASAGEYQYKAQVWAGRDELSPLSGALPFTLSCASAPSAVIDGLRDIGTVFCGETTTVAAVVTNSGEAALPDNARVWFYGEGSGWRGRHWIASVSAAGLGPGETGSYEAEWTAPRRFSAGNYVYKAQVWAGRHELSPLSQGMQYTVDCFDSASAEVGNLGEVSGAACGQTVTLSADVTNAGDYSLPDNSRLWFHVSGEGWNGSNWIGATHAGALPAGTTERFTLDWEVPEGVSGEHQYTAQVWGGCEPFSQPAPEMIFTIECAQ